MSTMVRALEKYRVVLEIVGGFCSVLLIPFCLWLINLQIQVQETKATVIELNVEKNESRKQLTRIERDLGIVIGELKRIKTADKSH